MSPKLLQCIICFGLPLVLGTGCASGTLGRITDSDELPKDLPMEQVQKFEIQDHALIKEPVALAASAPAKKGRGKKKKKGKDAAAAEVVLGPKPEVIEYPSRRPAKDPIWVGEKLTYGVSYFGVAAGEFVVQSLPHKSIGGREVYHIKGVAQTSKVFNLFYRLNDMVESFLDYEGLFSHRFHIVLDETKQSRDALELYDNEKAQTFYWNRWNRKEGFSETKEFAPMPRFAQDSLSVLYMLRMQPLTEGTELTLPVVSEGKSWEAVVTVMRREMMSTPMGKVQTVVVRPDTRYQGVLKKSGDSFLWLTDDERRVPVRLEAKVKVGTVVANLDAFEPGTPPPVVGSAPASVTAAPAGP